MFREGGDYDSILTPPTVTTGSMVWGLILRSTIIIAITMFVVMALGRRELWWFAVFLFWFGAVYPAYRQYSKYHARIENFLEETLCGKCRHFVEQSQLCDIYDEHVSEDYIPCAGESWEMREQ